MAFTEINIVLVGQGRVGTRLGAHLSACGQTHQILRIDPQRGLYRPQQGQTSPDRPLPDGQNREIPGHTQAPVQAGDPTVLRIAQLIVAISNAPQAPPQATGPAPRTWHWNSIFSGLRQQVNQGHLRIDRAILVGSTRVYDGIEHGLVDASTRPIPTSPQAHALWQGEQDFITLAERVYLLRCAGLYGHGYERYAPIMHAGLPTPRFGLDVETLIDRLLALARQPPPVEPGINTELLTDGYCYYAGEVLDARIDSAPLHALARCHRILRGSVIPDSPGGIPRPIGAPPQILN